MRVHGLHLLEQNFRDGFCCVVRRAFMTFDEQDFLWRLASACIQIFKICNYMVFDYFIRQGKLDVLIYIINKYKLANKSYYLYHDDDKYNFMAS